MAKRMLARLGRPDRNQPEIVDALVRAGAQVIDLTGVGDGCPDLLVGYRRENFLVEVKNPHTGGDLTPRQVEFARTWPGQTATVWDMIAALEVLGIGVTPHESGHVFKGKGRGRR